MGGVGILGMKIRGERGCLRGVVLGKFGSNAASG